MRTVFVENQLNIQLDRRINQGLNAELNLELSKHFRCINSSTIGEK